MTRWVGWTVAALLLAAGAARAADAPRPQTQTAPKEDPKVKQRAAAEAKLAEARKLVDRGQLRLARHVAFAAIRIDRDFKPAEELFRQIEKRLSLTLDLGGGVKMEFSYIPPGQFEMGSPPSEPNRVAHETPHTVRITRPFYFGTTEVTQAQYRAVMGKMPSAYPGDRLAVDMVSWDDAREFCRRLGKKTGHAVRLPTEAEWEYACRAGSKSAYAFGDKISTDQANFAGRFRDAKDPPGVFRSRVMDVASFKPNAWGLHDMHGNVWEWCADWYGPYGPDATDPVGPKDGTYRVLRGGSAWFVPEACRSAARGWSKSDYVSLGIGLRVVVEVK